ncbi:MAG: respiratory nitrate reductase subunit gamma [Candidatus Zixiibacteriota bacterium]
MNYFVFGILPYITIVLFAGGMINRLYVWTKTPQPGALTLFPAPSGGASTFFNVVKEAFLFPGLFKGDRLLWVFAWIFHATLALIVIGHVRVFTDFPALWNALGINADQMSAISGGTAGVIITIFALLLIFRRMTVLRVREVSNLSDFLALLLIVAILSTGNLMRFGEHFNLEITRAYFSQLLTFSLTASAVPQASMLMVHFLLAQVLIMVIPFSKVMHFGGIFFTKAIIQKS